MDFLQSFFRFLRRYSPHPLVEEEVNPCLDDDSLSEVFSYLPAKICLQLSLVSKRFRHPSSDFNFLLRQSYNNKIISGFFVKNYFGLHALFLVDPHAGVPESSLKLLGKDAKILASASGLVFYQSKRRYDEALGSLCVYNVARQHWWFLPSPPGGKVRDIHGWLLPSPSDRKFREIRWVGIAVSFVNDGDGVTRDYKLVPILHCGVYDSAI